jgi:hypothetical protein
MVEIVRPASLKTRVRQPANGSAHLAGCAAGLLGGQLFVVLERAVPPRADRAREHQAHRQFNATGLAGYSAITVPAGFAGDLPVRITCMGTAWSQVTHIRLAYSYELATQHPPPTTDLRARRPNTDLIRWIPAVDPRRYDSQPQPHSLS